MTSKITLQEIFITDMSGQVWEFGQECFTVINWSRKLKFDLKRPWKVGKSPLLSKSKIYWQKANTPKN